MGFILGVIIFGLVRFLLKKVTKPNIFKKKKNRNRSVQTDRFRFGSNRPVLVRFKPIGFGSVRFKPTGFGSVWFYMTKTGSNRFASVLARFFWFGSVLA